MASLPNTKHELFCNEFMKDRAAGPAAERAGYSPKSAYSLGYQLIQRDDIKARIAELAAAYLAVVQQDAASVLRLVVTQANTGLGSFITINADGDPVLDFSVATKAQLDTLQEITIDTLIDDEQRVKRVKIKVGDRLKAIDKLWEYTRLAAVQAETEAGALVSAIDQLSRVRGSAMPLDKQDDGK